ncbi:MAG: hypothetical protein Q9M50_04970 [Methylococcales bacterium]|nr:hypothetical protein [Methylococcales bacterium]
MGTLLEQLLTSVGITVLCDVKIMANPPEADILLLRRKTKYWTDEQRLRLPDGIRDSTASHILLEFKYSESVNEKAMQQTLGYDYFYKKSHHLNDSQVQSFLISARTPKADTLAQFSYQQSQYKGIYITQTRVLRQVVLIVLNELSGKEHNAWIKCFASRRLEKQKAFALLNQTGLNLASLRLKLFLSSLWGYWFKDREESKMRIELTEKDLAAMSDFWGDTFLTSLEVEDILPYFNAQELLDKINPVDKLAGLNAKERMVGLDAKERLEGLEVDAILSEVDHKKILAGLSKEEIKAYLSNN